MAKIRGTYVTNLKGRVGNVVYRTRNGENIASERPATVKNPRSNAQQRQRMIFATVSAAYSAMKEIADHSFEGITYGANSQAEFMRRNLSIMKSQVANFNVKGNPYALPNPLMISRGSLPSVAIDNELMTLEEIGDNAAAVTLPMPSFGITQGTITTYTVQKFHEDLGIEIGDQITLIGIANTYNGERIAVGNAPVQYQTSFVYARLVFNENAGDLPLIVGDKINTAALATESQNADAVICNEDLAVTGSLAISSQLWRSTGDDVVAGTVIISRKSGQTWQRSTQLLSVNSGSSDTQFTADKVLPSYSPTGEKYLNNATV